MRHDAGKGVYVCVCLCVAERAGGREGREKGTYTCGEQGGGSICRAGASQGWQLLKYPKEPNILPPRDRTSSVFRNRSANSLLTK